MSMSHKLFRHSMFSDARLLDHLLLEAGNPALMTADLKDALCAHASGNPGRSPS